MFRWVLLAALAGAQFAALAAGAEPPDLSGKWNADLPKCDFGVESVPSSLVYDIAQKGLSLRVERVRNEGGKETKTTRTFDARWDGTALIVECRANYQAYELEVSERWSLSEDKKQLTVMRSIAAAEGSTDQKLVFRPGIIRVTRPLGPKAE